MKASTCDPWQPLTQHTHARIAVGRAGGSLRSQTLLENRLAQARARDAVQVPLDPIALGEQLARAGMPWLLLHTEASNRREYLLNPELGRQLDEVSRRTVSGQRRSWAECGLAIVVSDGLSAVAAEQHCVPLLATLLPLLQLEAFTYFPIFVVPLARVKLADCLGEILCARQSLILLGERPGLSAPNSLGAYLTYGPRASCSDAERNCVSNIRPEGLTIALAAQRVAALLVESRRRKVSGIILKDDRLPVKELV